MPTLLAVNIGTPTLLPGSATPTGIVKTPRTGPVLIDEMGIVGDVIVDRKHHGGPNQAIYVYLQSDYAFWNNELGYALEPGTFGENLTVDGIDGADLAIGDRLQVGGVTIEVSYHRTPCNTLARRMGSPSWVKRFARALRPGAYARVLQPGMVEAGMAVTHIPFAGERVGVSELMSHDGARSLPPELVARLLTTPVRHKTRQKYEAMQ